MNHKHIISFATACTDRVIVTCIQNVDKDMQTIYSRCTVRSLQAGLVD